MHQRLVKLTTTAALAALVFGGCTTTPPAANCAKLTIPTQDITLTTVINDFEADDSSAVQPPELKEYCDFWTDVEARISKEATQSIDNSLETQPLPATPAQLAVPLEAFRTSGVLLLKAYARCHREDIPTATLDKIQSVHSIHEQTAMIYHSLDNCQHGISRALPLLLNAGRKLLTLPMQRDSASLAVAAVMSNWLSCWNDATPIEVLPSLWMVTDGKADEWPIYIPKNTPRVHFSAGRSELPIQSPIQPDSDGMLCLRQYFALPATKAGQNIAMVFPALPVNTQIVLNDKMLCEIDGNGSNKPFAISLQDESLDKELAAQRITVRLPATEIGRAVFPICLAYKALSTEPLNGMEQ